MQHEFPDKQSYRNQNFDIEGKIKGSVILKERAGQYIYDTRLIPDGTYIYTFYSERSAPVSGKFSVRK